MHELILRTMDGAELARRPMEAQERLDWYRLLQEGDELTFQGACYRLHSVAWRKPAQDCEVLVSFLRWVT
jgi:hypothetical protein